MNAAETMNAVKVISLVKGSIVLAVLLVAGVHCGPAPRASEPHRAARPVQPPPPARGTSRKVTPGERARPVRRPSVKPARREETLPSPPLSSATEAERKLFALAERYWSQMQFAVAIRVYSKLTRNPRSALGHYAQYKIGWCHLNLRRYGHALMAFVKLLKTQSISPQLRRAVLADLVRVFAYIGRPDKAYLFFLDATGKKADQARTLLTRLGTLYTKQGKYMQAVTVFQIHLRRWPKSKKRCLWGEKIAEIAVALRRKPQVIIALKRLAALYNGLAKKHGAQDAVVRSCRTRVMYLLGSLARQWRREARLTRNPRTAQSAEILKKLYHKTFGRYP